MLKLEQKNQNPLFKLYAILPTFKFEFTKSKKLLLI